ncbi:MAG: dipicolinate synthase subunit B [Oscillospiraceae bacterium]|nr:dipicolinate synthase subunit B [Oscillospiraceae bacterium]
MSGLTVGFAICGSFCTFSKVLPEIRNLVEKGIEVVPIMSETAYSTDTRFGNAKKFAEEVEKLCAKDVIHTITQAEPIGPKKLLDILIIAPCTGNTIGKLASGINDTAVTLAAKAHLRNLRPILIGVSTNDALSAAAANIGRLMNSKNVYFIPMSQDDSAGKPNSMVADFTRTHEAMTAAMDGRQLQPVLGII